MRCHLRHQQQRSSGNHLPFLLFQKEMWRKNGAGWDLLQLVEQTSKLDKWKFGFFVGTDPRWGRWVRQGSVFVGNSMWVYSDLKPPREWCISDKPKNGAHLSCPAQQAGPSSPLDVIPLQLLERHWKGLQNNRWNSSLLQISFHFAAAGFPLRTWGHWRLGDEL